MPELTIYDLQDYLSVLDSLENDFFRRFKYLIAFVFSCSLLALLAFRDAADRFVSSLSLRLCRKNDCQ